MKFSQKRLARPSLGGIMATRQGSLLLALLCAVIAAVILMFALGRYKSNLNVVPQQATVLVATGEIHKGMTGEQIAAQHLYKSTPVVQSQMSTGALSNAGTLSTSVAQTDILPGQQLTSTQFSASAGSAALLAPNQRAISVAVDEAHGDADTLAAGDHIDIYANIGSSGGVSGAQSNDMVLLVPDATVIKPGTSTTVHTDGRTVTGSALVLAVQSKDVPELFLTASQQGALWVSLRPTNAAPTPKVPVTLQSILTQDN